jgi:hypothetical protein
LHWCTRSGAVRPAPIYADGIEPLTLIRALRSGGVATLGALAARTGAPRDELLWAVEEALARGWISASGPGCGDGICSTSAPTVYAISERGRAAVS